MSYKIIDEASPDAIQNYILQHLEKKITVTSLAVAFNTSTRTINRAIKNLFEVSPYHFIKHVKLAKAVKLLAETNKSVKQVAKEVGYHDCSSFDHAFKKYFDITPGYIKSVCSK